MKILWLDDIRDPYYKPHLETVMKLSKEVTEDNVEDIVHWARNYEEFLEYIHYLGLPDIVSFDHDLAQIHYDPTTRVEGFKYDEETGLDCAKWLVEYCMNNNLPLPKYNVHSQNPVGKENIEKYLNNFNKNK